MLQKNGKKKMTKFLLLLLILFYSLCQAIILPETRDLSFEGIPSDISTDLGITLLPVSSVKEILPNINGFGVRSGGRISFELSLQGNLLETVDDAGVLFLALPQESWKYLQYARYDQIAGYTYFFCDAASQFVCYTFHFKLLVLNFFGCRDIL